MWTNLFVFDAARRLTNVTSPAGVSAYSYRAGLSSLQLARLSLPNTSYITNTYDGVARLTGTYLKNSGNSTLDSYVYIYDPANERTNLTRFDASTVGYKFDPIGQLKVANSSVNTEDTGYAYDAAWNLVDRTNNGVLSTMAVDSLNQLGTDSASVHYYYDANGNLNWQVFGSDPWWWTTAEITSGYQYDDENRLSAWTFYDYNNTSFPQLQTQFFYDGLGRLRKRVEYQAQYSGGEYLGLAWVGETHYIYDGWRVIQERERQQRSHCQLHSWERS